jgi:hypothetical protein
MTPPKEFRGGISKSPTRKAGSDKPNLWKIIMFFVEWMVAWF